VARSEDALLRNENPKFKIGDRVLVNGWGGERELGTVTDVKPTYHSRCYEYAYGCFVKFDPGFRNPLTMAYIPEGYIRLAEEKGTDEKMGMKVMITSMSGKELTTVLPDDNTEQEVLNRLGAPGDFIRCVDIKTGRVSVIATEKIDFWTFI
jgi:hypothetical protein